MILACWLKTLQEATYFKPQLWFALTLAIETVSKNHDNYKQKFITEILFVV